MRVILDGISYKVVGLQHNIFGVVTIFLDTGDKVCKLDQDIVEIEYSHDVNALLDEFESIFFGKGIEL